MSSDFISYIANLVVTCICVLGLLLVFSRVKYRRVPIYIVVLLMTCLMYYGVNFDVINSFILTFEVDGVFRIIGLFVLIYFTFYSSLCLALDAGFIKDRRTTSLKDTRKYMTILNIVIVIVFLTLYVV